MSPEFLEKWEHILDHVDKKKIPVEFISKMVIKMLGKKQRTINVKKLIDQGLKPSEIEEALSRKLVENDSQIVSVEFMLNVETIAETVQPETDRLLGKL
jgi:hypothetical protein